MSSAPAAPHPRHSPMQSPSHTMVASTSGPPGTAGGASATSITRTTSRRKLGGLSRTASIISTVSSDGQPGAAAGGGSGLGEATLRMRKQLDELRRNQLDIAKRHIEIGAKSLNFTGKDLEPPLGTTNSNENENEEEVGKEYAKLRQTQIDAKEKDVHELMGMLQDLGAEMSRLHFDKAAVAGGL